MRLLSRSRLIYTDSDFFYRLRGIAIISVACAHCLQLSNPILSKIGALLGTIGVPIFFICSGYFFKRIDKASLKKKCNSIILPWIIWGSFSYSLSVYLSSGGLSFYEWFLYLIGHGTWLYYVPVYLLIILFYSILPARLGGIDIVVIFTSLSSNILSYIGVFDFAHDYITLYQNPLNFILFFAVGRLVRRYNNSSIIRVKVFMLILIMIIAMLLVYCFIIVDLKAVYTNPYSILFELLSIIIISVFLSQFKFRHLLQYLGKNSYIIYFLHMQVGIGIVNALFLALNIKQDILIFVMKPMSVVLLTMMIAFILTKFIDLLKLSIIKGALGLSNV